MVPRSDRKIKNYSKAFFAERTSTPGSIADHPKIFYLINTLKEIHKSSLDFQIAKWFLLGSGSTNVNDLFDDAYTSISREGAGNIEVAIHIQKSLKSISSCFGKDSEFKDSATNFARQSFKRSQQALAFSDDIERLRKCSFESQE